MNFKKILYIFLSSIFLIFTSCNQSSELSDVIPADASYVVHVDVSSLIEKSQYDVFQNTTVQQGINMYKALLKDNDKIKILDDFLKDPNSLGLNIKDDIYFYTDYNYYGVAIGVNDANRLKEALTRFSLVREDNLKKNGDVYLLSPESTAVVAWNDKKLLLLVDLKSSTNYGKEDKPLQNIEERAIAQLKQNADKSINSIKAFGEFVKEKKDISAFYTMKGFDKIPLIAELSGVEVDLDPVKKALENMNGVSIGMHTSFEKGEISMTSKYYYDTPEVEKRIAELAESMFGTIKGEHLKHIPSDPIFMLTTNIKGEGISDYLKDLGVIKMAENELSDVFQDQEFEQLIRGFNGDLTFVLSSIKQSKIKISDVDEYLGDMYVEEAISIPECVLFADVESPEKTVNFIKGQFEKNKGKYKELTPAIFMVESNGVKVYLGVHESTFFATNIESIYKDLNYVSLKNDYSDLIKNKMFALSGDVQALKPYLPNQNNFSQLIKFVDELGKYQISVSSKDYVGQGSLDFKVKDKNSLAVICLQIDEMINNFSSALGF